MLGLGGLLGWVEGVVVRCWVLGVVSVGMRARRALIQLLIIELGMLTLANVAES